MGFEALIQFLLPKEDHFYEMLEELGGLCHEAATALAQFSQRPAADVRKDVQTIEHRADDVVRRMEDALARTFVTPLDREDLHRLTSELDDIVDLANLTGRAFHLYHLERPTPDMVALMSNLTIATQHIRDAVPHLRKRNFSAIVEASRKVRQVEKEADTIYRSAISALFSAAQIEFRDLLKQKEALDDLERAVDHCDNVADLLSNLAVKHG
jgi:uncharacterized protein